MGNFLLNDVLGTAFTWLDDSERLLVRMITPYRDKAPDPTAVPTGPTIDETTTGKLAQVSTYQDLLQNPNDEKLFEYYAASVLALAHSSTLAKLSPIWGWTCT